MISTPFGMNWRESACESCGNCVQACPTGALTMKRKKQYGPNSLVGFACSRSPNEDVYMVQKMVRCCFETNNVNNCARVCHSASVAGLAMTLGSGAMTNPIRDITHDVDCIMLVGSNPEEAHPVVGMQIRRAVVNGAKLIVVDPRDIALSKQADIHLKLKPGTNVAFANGIMKVILSEGLEDQQFIQERTEGFEKSHPGTPIMYVGKFTRGLGWFYPAEYVPSAELPDADYPIILMTGRILYHYTTRAMSSLPYFHDILNI